MGSLRKLLLALGVLVVALALLELAASLWLARPESPLATPSVADSSAHDEASGAPAGSIFGKDDYLRWRFPASARGLVMDGNRFDTNRLGLRGPEPQQRAHRVVCMGDSVTFGWDASGDDRTYPARLAEELADLDVDVVNAGVPRWSAMDLLRLYPTRIRPLEPDVVVVMAGWNDLGYQFLQGWMHAHASARQGGAAELSLVTLARRLGRGLGNEDARASDDASILAAREQASDPVQWQYVEEYARVLGALCDLIRADGAEPVLLTLPNFLEDGLTPAEKRTMLPHLRQFVNLSYDGYTRAVLELNDAVREAARTHGATLIECGDAVPAERFTDTAHLDDEGNVLLARRVAGPVRELLEER